MENSHFFHAFRRIYDGIHLLHLHRFSISLPSFLLVYLNHNSSNINSSTSKKSIVFQNRCTKTDRTNKFVLCL